MKDQQRFEATLGNFGLIGGVLRVPAGVLEDAALDDAWDNDPRIPHAEPRAGGLILLGHGLQLLKKFGLAQWAVGQSVEGEFFFVANIGRDRRVGERVQGVEAERSQHVPKVAGSGADMAKRKGV